MLQCNLVKPKDDISWKVAHDSLFHILQMHTVADHSRHGIYDKNYDLPCHFITKGENTYRVTLGGYMSFICCRFCIYTTLGSWSIPGDRSIMDAGHLTCSTMEYRWGTFRKGKSHLTICDNIKPSIRCLMLEWVILRVMYYKSIGNIVLILQIPAFNNV